MIKGIFLDESNVLKALLYVLIFVFVCLLLFLLLIVPVSRDFQRANLRFLTQEDANALLHENLVQSRQKLEMLKSENEFVLSQFVFPFKQDEFIKYVEQYGEDIQVRSMPISKPEPYLQLDLNISSNLTSLNKFYDFLNSLNMHKSLVKADYPIVLEARGDKIFADGNFKVYFVDENNASAK